MTVDNQEVSSGLPAAISAAAGRTYDELALLAVDASDPSLRVSKASLDAAREMVRSSGRRVDTPVRKSFVRPMVPEAWPRAPLSVIYGGGRGGTVAVKLYLALLWRCSAAPFSTDKPTRAWATLLDLPDPAGRGARRVKDALRTLTDAGLITVQAQAGYPNIVTLLDESGLGKPYELPSTAYSRAERFGTGQEQLAASMYFKLSPALWTRGYIQQLTGPALVMLLILLAEQAGTGEKVWFSTEQFPLRYNISHKTRAAGTRELIRRGLLTIETQSLPTRPGASTFDIQRRRKIYRLTTTAQTTTPEPLPSPARPTKPRRPADPATRATRTAHQ